MRCRTTHLVLALAFLTMQAAAQSAPPEKGFGCDAVYFLDLDQTPAPSSFLDATPVSTEFEDVYGVTFIGPAPEDGGAILDEAIGFGVSGQSSPNFLAFDESATYSGGGAPRGPQTLEFAGPNLEVQINAGLCESCGDSGTLSLECFDAEGESLGIDSIVGSATLQTLGVRAIRIFSCELSFTSTTAIFDDLVYIPCEDDGQTPAIIPTLNTWGLIILLSVLIVMALGFLGRSRSTSRLDP